MKKSTIYNVNVYYSNNQIDYYELNVNSVNKIYSRSKIEELNINFDHHSPGKILEKLKILNLLS